MDNVGSLHNSPLESTYASTTLSTISSFPSSSHMTSSYFERFRDYIDETQLSSTLLVTLLIIAYTIAGCVITIPYASNASFVHKSFYSICFSLLLIFAIFSLIFLWLCRLIDPGYLKTRIELNEQIDDETRTIISNNPSPWSIPKRTIIKNNIEIFEEWCHLCQIWRPLRSGHCSQCGHCVERFDHHCAVIGSCIGRLNHRFFTLFLCCVGFGSTLSLIIDWIWLCSIPFWKSSAWSNWQVYIGIIFALLYSYTFFVLFFAIFHITLFCFDITTRERYGHTNKQLNCSNVKYPWEPLFNVCKTVCCAPIQLYQRKTNIKRSSLNISFLSQHTVNTSISPNQQINQNQNNQINQTNDQIAFTSVASNDSVPLNSVV